MMSGLASEMLQSLTSPQESARRIVAWNLPGQVLWALLLLVAIVSILLTHTAIWLAPDNMKMPVEFPSSPILQAFMFYGALLIMVCCTHFIARMFGGTGRFDDSLALMIWLQVVLLALQLVQLGVMFFSPVLAGIVGIVVVVFAVWLFVNFVAAIHGFKSLGLVFAGAIISGFGVLFGLSLILAVIGVLLGLDFGRV